MRVTNTTLYRKYTNTVNEVHSKYNKALDKISSGAAYETAAENPLAYYSGKRMDNQYQDVLSKQELLTDLENRMYQQELGVRSIQEELATGSGCVNTQILYILNGTNNDISTTVNTVQEALIQKEQSMVNSLNAQYENFFIFGGNDLSTTPYALSYDSENDDITLTYTHTFSGETEPTVFEFKLIEEENDDGSTSFTFKLQDQDMWEDLKSAMSEQGRVDVGYGSISDKDTLIDTYTNGMNILTGYTSDVMRSENSGVVLEDIEKALADSAIGITGQAIIKMNQYIRYLDSGSEEAGTGSDGLKTIDKDTFFNDLGNLIEKIDIASHSLGTAYSVIGNKYSLLETTADKLEEMEISLEEQYSDLLGADPYDSIIEMYSYQQSYYAALQVSSNIMSTSLFDFIK